MLDLSPFPLQAADTVHCSFGIFDPEGSVFVYKIYIFHIFNQSSIQLQIKFSHTIYNPIAVIIPPTENLHGKLNLCLLAKKLFGI